MSAAQYAREALERTAAAKSMKSKQQFSDYDRLVIGTFLEEQRAVSGPIFATSDKLARAVIAVLELCEARDVDDPWNTARGLATTDSIRRALSDALEVEA